MQFIIINVNNSKVRLFCYRQKALSLDKIGCTPEAKA